MPFIRRPGKPTLHYRVDDFTDPRLRECARHVLDFVSGHDAGV